MGPSFQAGSVLEGKYLIERVVGEGGLGVVVLARHVQLEQPVAIKYLKPQALDNPVLIERFVREARLAAKIRSDHVVRVHDVGSDPNGAPYMVMEYLEGNDLSSLLEQAPMPTEQVVDFVLQACEALAEAHALGIVHRDLKPENLFLARRAAGSSIVKVLDFGISKLRQKESDATRERNLTGTTDRFGTPQYMSPEQLNSSASVDARADIWALGIVLHELLTGTRPFEGDSFPELCASVIGRSYVGLREARPDAPPGLDVVIGKCLEKRAAQRFRNVAELALELAPFGPPGAVARVEHIGRVIREGGESIRPARTRARIVVERPPDLAMTGSGMRPVAKTVRTPSAGTLPRVNRAAVICGVLAAAMLVLVATVRPIPVPWQAGSGAPPHGRPLDGSPEPAMTEISRPLEERPLPPPAPPKRAPRRR